MTLYLTDNTSPDEIAKAKAAGFVKAVKYYPAGATTNSDSGVTDIRKCDAVLEAMAAHGMPLLLHGEVTDPAVDVFDREKVFIDTVAAARSSAASRSCAWCSSTSPRARRRYSCRARRRTSRPRSRRTTCS